MSDTHESGYFTEDTSAEVVIARNAKAPDARLAEVMSVITRHLHAAVKEIEPTQEEWFKAIMFLTKTGQMCNEWRQEFILLSDVTGVSMLVDAIIRNTSAYRQPFPLLEMKFTDINNLVIATRRFLPKEYLGGEMAGLRFIPALTEVRLGLEIVDPGKNAFGYALEAVPAI